LSGQIHGQECVESVFNVEVRESEYGGTYVAYSDKNWDKFKSSPKFMSTVPSDGLINIKFVSIQKKDSIEQTLFKAEELDLLRRGFAMCQIHIPSGRIVSVSFSIPITNKVKSEKIIWYKNEIEKNLYFDVTLYSKLKKEGYLVQSFPIFVSRRKR
jgi:hypothetical protein